MSNLSKILVARYSPENSCFVPEGEILSVLPRQTVGIRTRVAHYFVGTTNPRLKSRYGWVKEVPPFSLSEFLEQNHPPGSLNEERVSLIEVMLKRIAGLPDGTPTAAGFAVRGVEERHMEFDVHRVIFQRDRTQTGGS